MAALSAFIMIFFIKRKGIIVLKYIFGFSFGFLGYFMGSFFGSIILWLIYNLIPGATQASFDLAVGTFLPILNGIFVVILIYRYFTSESHKTRNFIVIYIRLLINAMITIIMPLVTTLTILIRISL